MNDLTFRQAEILALIRKTLETTGMPPTRAEIAAHFGFRSTYAAEKHLQALAKKGAIELLPGASRGIRLPAADLGEEVGLAVIGRVAAGAPILAQESIEDHIKIDPRLFQPQADYLLRVRGMSMQDAGIFDGDLLAVAKAATAENGQIVVARVEGEVTVKRLKRSQGKVELLPENVDFEPIVVDASCEDFGIEGIAVGSIRTDGFGAES